MFISDYKINLIDTKETYVVWFENSMQADFWRIKFIEKFVEDVIWIDRWGKKVGFLNQTWYFRSHSEGQRAIKGIGHNIIQYPQEAIYIILDDYERKRLDTYVEEENGSQLL